MKLLRACLVSAGVALSLFTFAEPATPNLQIGKFVYQSPEGYLPPRIKSSMLADLQRKAASQRYPFYIVLMDRVSDDQAASRIGDRFLDDWARNPRFNVQRSSLFLVTFEGDRKFRLFPAPEWRSKLGLEKNESGDALVQFTSVFLQSAKSGNPVEGISNLMEAYNSYIFERIDPVRVAQLAKARQQQAERQRIYEIERERVLRDQRSQAELDLQIQRMAGLLANKEFVPKDTSAYQNQLSQARDARSRQDTEEMDRQAGNMQISADELQAYVGSRLAEAQHARRSRSLVVLSLVGGLGLLVFTAIGRRAVYKKEVTRFRSEIEAWRAKISGARLRYYDKIYNQETDYYSQRLKEYPPDSETGKLFEATVKETDDIISQVEALAIHIDTCEKIAKGATVFSLRPLRQAGTKLNASFEFDTQQISSKLMDPMSSTIKVDPHIEEENLNVRFEQVVQAWSKLKTALNNSNIPSSELFKHDDLDLMISQAKDSGIPLRWLKKHPLYGGADEDEALFAVLDAPRQADPVLYCREVEKNWALQAAIRQDLDRLMGAVRLAKSEEDAELSGLENTVLAPDDDPKITLDRARQNQDRLAGLLESSDSVDEVEQQAQKTCDLFRTCKAQAGAARSAIASAHQEVEEANALLTSLQAECVQAAAAVQGAAEVHANMAATHSALEAGQRHLATGKSYLDSAVVELNNKAHLAGLRLATTALEQFANCKDRFEAVYRSIADLDRAKEQYEQKLERMDGLYAEAVGQIRRYNGRSRDLIEYQRPAIGHGPVDYALLGSMLAAQEQSWETEVLSAKRDYDIEIARQQEEERRRHREEEERRRQSSVTSSHSSSGGSWSSGGGSSGGSWGSGSGGGGSSGGSW